MQRLLTASVLGLVFAVLAAPASAQTVYLSDGFEAADGHATLGASPVGTNGWFEDGIGGGGVAPAPQIAEAVPGLSGQVLSGNNPGGQNGQAWIAIANPAGIGGGLDASKEYTVSWDWLVNRDQPTGSTGFGLDGTRSSMSINRHKSTSVEGWELNIADPADTDERYALPLGGGVEQVLNLEMIINSSTIQYFMNGSLLQTSPSSASSGQFGNIHGIRYSINKDPNIGGGFIDNIRVAETPEPASLSLLALGSMAMLRRRRA